VFALTEAPRYGWTSPTVVLSFAVFVAAITWFVRRERSQDAPLVDPAHLARRAVWGANATMLLATAVMCSVLFFVSLYLQLGLDYSPLATGAVFLPMTGLILVVAPLAGRLADRIGDRAPATAGMATTAIGLALLAILGLEGGLGWLVPALALVGLGVGLVTTPVTAAALTGAPTEETGIAAGVLNTSRMVGLSLGITIMSALVAAQWPGGLENASVRADEFADGLALAFLINAVLAAATTLLAAITLPASARTIEPAQRTSETGAAPALMSNG
jgi:MFS family permease